MWELIRVNKRNSVLLLLGMGVVLFSLGYVVSAAVAGDVRGGVFGILIAGVIWIAMLLTSYYGGREVMLAASKAQKVTHEVHPQLFNVVDELTIAASLPKRPDIYIINDPGLNAFATGRDPEHAAVAVTAGLLGQLNRDELQGVMAHEVSHILHRDILFVTLAGVALGAIVIISQVFLRGMLYGGGRRSRYSSRGRGAGKEQAVLLVVALLCAILAPLFAQLLYYALSRKREYLADAGAARLTRYPEGLASALGKLAVGGRVESANKATAPMYVVNPLQTEMNVSGWTSTHPPLQDRIRILRGMMHGASYRDYADSYSAVTHETGVIPAAALAESGAVAFRGGQEKAASEESARHRMREVGDIRHRLNDFVFVPCECGVKLKAPPRLKGRTVKCPRCKRPLTVPSEGASG